MTAAEALRQFNRPARADGVDLRAAARLLDLPIPIAVARAVIEPELGVLGALGRFALLLIEYDLPKILFQSEDPNVLLLHELVHARQWFDDPLGFCERANRELADYGYANAPHEVEARTRARELHEAGVRVYFPECTPDLSQFEDLEDARAAFEAWSATRRRDD